jgi:alpha-mannosidase
MNSRLLLLAAVGALAAMSAHAEDTRIYLAPDDHTDFLWSDTESNYHTHFLNMLDYYQQKADDTAGNDPRHRSKFTIDGTLWLQTFKANRTGPQFAALMQKIKDGHITAPLAPLCLSYGLMPAEAVLRGMYYSGKLERQYDMRFRLAQAMENQTMALGVGSLWAGSGAKYVWQGICGCDTQVPNLTLREHEMYTWRGRDGSSLLTKWYSFRHNKEVGGYAETRNLQLSLDWATGGTFRARHPWPIIGLFGQGWDDVVTMNQDLVTAAQNLTTPTQSVIVSNELDFFQDFEANHGAPALAEKTVSFGNEWDTYCTSMAEVSASVKRSVEKLRSAEAMATLVNLKQPAFMQGREAARELAFQDMGLYFEHDFTAVGNNFTTQRKAWQRRLKDEIASYVDTLHTDAKAALGGLIAQTGANARFMVFNPLSWARTDFADFPYTGSASIHVVDLATNAEVPFQIVTVDAENHLRIWAADVPAVGYKVFEIRDGAGTSFTGAPSADAVSGVMSNVR